MTTKKGSAGKQRALFVILLAAALIVLVAALIITQTDSQMKSNEPPLMKVFALNVGKADAFVITAGGRAAVVDCGEAIGGAMILDCLKENGIGEIDCLFITHFDKDHVGGAAKIINTLPVGRIYTSFEYSESGEYDAYLKAAADAGVKTETVLSKTEFEWGDARITVYPPQKSYYGKNNTSNNSSLAVMIRVGGRSAFFTGDAEKDRLKELSALEDDISCDLLKIPSHGEYRGALIDFISRTSPEYAVITSSAAEPEDIATLLLLERYNVKTYLTRQGEVVFSFFEDRIEACQN
ncbi:MAG: ComEC/Rec2 family competence protein [Eubacteriales bacterium]|jgi:competence protein ComEC